MDTCCTIRREMAEHFATAARLYAEAVVLFTRKPLSQSRITIGWSKLQKRRSSVQKPRV
jgi:hypothetical protein